MIREKLNYFTQINEWSWNGKGIRVSGCAVIFRQLDFFIECLVIVFYVLNKKTFDFIEDRSF